MRKILLDNIFKICNLGGRSPYVVGVDIGTSSMKIVGMNLAQRPSVLFYSLIELPKNYTDSYLTETIKKALKDNNFSSKDAALTFSDESVIIRRIELPHMPQGEIIDALRWKAKELLPFDIQNSPLGFEALGEFQKEDGSKVLDVIFAAVSKDVIDRNIKILKEALLNVVSVGVIPFGLENILNAAPEIDASKTVLVADIGYAKTGISILKNKRLEFVRLIPLGSGNISEALQGKILSEKGEVAFSPEEAEGLKRRLGVSYEEVALENGISSITILSMMRPVLEQLSKEIRRSVEYYVQEFGKDDVQEIYLVGGGSNLKNLDKYLGEELKVPVRKMKVPSAVDLSRTGLNNADASSFIPLIGVILGCSSHMNLLPHEYRAEKIEFIEKVSLRLTATIMAMMLLVSFLFTKFRVDDYNRRLKSAPVQKNILAQVKDLKDRVKEREVLMEQASMSETPLEYIMRELSNMIPSDTVLETLDIDNKAKMLNMKGSFYGPRSSAQEVLTKFMEDLEKSRYFKDAQLSSLAGSRSGGEEISSFEITSILE